MNAGLPMGRGAVTQVSKFATRRIRRGGPTVSPPASRDKSAGCASRRNLRVWKPAIQSRLVVTLVWLRFRRLMLKGFFWAAFCSLLLIGQMHAQEVIVARETKPAATKQPKAPSEQVPSESPTPAPAKPKSRTKKSASKAPTIEQMREAGALAAEGLENRGPSHQARTRGSDAEPTATETPPVFETAKPVKRETLIEQRSTPRPSKPRGTKLEAIGPVRPTMIESGREQPSATPSAKGVGARFEQTPAP